MINAFISSRQNGLYAMLGDQLRDKLHIVKKQKTSRRGSFLLEENVQQGNDLAGEVALQGISGRISARSPISSAGEVSRRP